MALGDQRGVRLWAGVDGVCALGEPGVGLQETVEDSGAPV